jgi:class 3 adenylate cyclase/tetratricopeptide (TPR) repeat protein
MRSGAPQLREERKVVTALFADLVGSTAIGERFDPEDAREIVSGAIALMIGAVERYGGTVKDLAGDGLLALFGAPVSHEDDVERAILAGLEITGDLSAYGETVARDWGYEGVDVRVGIETGMAVLGPVGAGERVEYGAVGDVLNTASRLQSAARPGSVVVGETAQREAAGLFEWESPTTHSLKGKDELVVASVAVKPRAADSRVTRRSDAPLVGRTEELRMIDDAMADLAGGTGSAILVTGEPGIGKSRLVAEARRRAISGRYGAQITWLEGRCLSWADGVPYGVYRHLLSGWLDVSSDDPADRIASALEATAGAGAVDPAHVDLLGLVIAPGGRDPEVLDGPGDAETIRERVFGAIEATLERLARTDPLAISLEDLHWADPTSLALTERLLSAVREAPFLVFVTHRPEAEHPAARSLDAAMDHVGSHARRIDLRPLAEDEHRELLRSLIGDEGVPERIRSRILATTDGNPLFLEEQVRSLEESGALVRDGQGRPRFQEGEAADIPRTVERVLLARIDRLDPADKDVLLAASVLGREFEPELLDRVIEHGQEVGASLDRLIDIDLVRADQHGSDVRFRFKHALIQEAAYRSLLKRRRKELHGRAAAAIETSYEGRTEQVAGALGRHLQEAGELERAVPFLVSAGDRAREAFANEEAISWYGRALDAIDGISRTKDLDRWGRTEADLHARRGDVLSLSGRYVEARRAYARSLEILPPDDGVRNAEIRTEAALIEISDHRYREALDHLDRAERELGPLGDDDPPDPERSSAWFEIQQGRMSAFYWLDDLTAYSDLIERVRPYVETRGTARQRADFFEDLLTFALRRDRYAVTPETVGYARSNLSASEQTGDATATAWARFNLGFTLLWESASREAEQLLEASVHEGDRIGDITLVSRGLTYSMVLHRKIGDVGAVEREIERVISAARDASLPEYEAMAIANRSWVHRRRRRDADAEADARNALDLWRSLPVRYPFEWMALWPLLDIHLERDHLGEAIACARDMLEEHQQPLPLDLRTGAERAVDAWSARDHDGAARELRSALPLARRLAYL